VIVADYSAKRLTGAQLQSAGFVGAIRYAGLSESNIKITNAAEVTSIKAAGLAVALVYELGLTDTSGGYNAGRANATALRNHALALGLPARGFLAQDQHIPAGQSTNVLAYFQGAASVLGAANTGVYGFYDTMDLTRNLGLGAYWQCGAHSDLRSWASVYQRNYGTYSAGGIACDANDILATDWLQSPSVAPNNQDNTHVIYNTPNYGFVTVEGGIMTGLDTETVTNLAAAPNIPVLKVSANVATDLLGKSSQLQNGAQAAAQLGAKLDALLVAVQALTTAVQTTHTTFTGDVPVTGSLHLGS